jgi:DNA anti-recombination protein RmuC
MVGQGKNKLTQALNAAKDETDNLQQKLGSAKDSLTDHINNLSSKMTDLQEEASSRIDQMLQATTSNQQSLEGGLQGILSDIIQTQVQEMTQEMTAKVSSELKDLLDGAMDTVKGSLGGLADRVFGGTDENKASQELLDPLFEAAEGLLKPAEVFIDAIKAAASIVGIDISA